MKIKLTFFLILLTSIIFAQSKTDYLSQNRVDLRSEKPNNNPTINKLWFYDFQHLPFDYNFTTLRRMQLINKYDTTTIAKANW